MKYRVLFVTTILFSFIFSSCPVAQQREKTVEEPLQITGVLLNSDKSPVVGETVYFLPWTGSGTRIEWDKDGKLINPTGLSDAKGRFIIKVSRRFVDKGQKFVLGIDALNINEAKILSRGDFIETHVVQKETSKIDLGEIIIKNRK